MLASACVNLQLCFGVCTIDRAGNIKGNIQVWKIQMQAGFCAAVDCLVDCLVEHCGLS